MLVLPWKNQRKLEEKEKSTLNKKLIWRKNEGSTLCEVSSSKQYYDGKFFWSCDYNDTTIFLGEYFSQKDEIQVLVCGSE